MKNHIDFFRDNEAVNSIGWYPSRITVFVITGTDTPPQGGSPSCPPGVGGGFAVPIGRASPALRWVAAPPTIWGWLRRPRLRIS